MKGCRIFHGRSAGRYLKYSNWNYSTSASKSIADAKDFKNVTSSSATTCDLSQGGRADGIQTTTVEGGEGQRDGNGKGNKRRELPLSPLMDPLFQEARNKHSAPKPQPKKEDRTAFQEQLAKNPYGIIVSNYISCLMLTRPQLSPLQPPSVNVLQHNSRSLVSFSRILQ